ncbi:hypothetical protein VD0004_g9693 [Verticillium dahliae]|uniref:CCHC-type domain-containing protein n=1 Tax=Verticillium dahliae TaxID=27337 RepID=A0A444RJU9_VERDA|nr:hypothetical protein VD0004_g9693 [Verticillium dahliae]PNH61425.1 hypothetical protein VD0001_g9693 [Verticillium dahliae]RXG41384.1 hypothetical protein VDGE_09851 [Verticillium dahliae]
MGGGELKSLGDAEASHEPSRSDYSHRGLPFRTRSRSPPRHTSQTRYRDRDSQHQEASQWRGSNQRSLPLLSDMGSLFRVDLEQRDPDRSARAFRIVPTTHDGGRRHNTIGQTLNGATKVAIIHNRESLMAWAERMAAALEERGPGGELSIISAVGDLSKRSGNRPVIEHWDGSGLFCRPSSAGIARSGTKASFHTNGSHSRRSRSRAPSEKVPGSDGAMRMGRDAPQGAFVAGPLPDQSLGPDPSWQLCQNCGGLGHHPACCTVPGPSGFTHVCPLCNSTRHLVDECAQWHDKTIWQRLDILVRHRAGKPPLATVAWSWPNMVNDTRDKMAFNPPNSWVEITEYPLDFLTVQRIISMPGCPQSVWRSHERFSAYLAHIGARSFYTSRFFDTYRVPTREQVYNAVRL